MSYGSRRELKKKLKKLEEINNFNVKDFLKLAADQYASEYAAIVNDRASDRETAIDSRFLGAVANKNFLNALEAFKNDIGNDIRGILRDIIKKQTNIDYETGISDEMKRYFSTTKAKTDFFEAARIGIRKIFENPIKAGLSRTVLQKYLQ